MVSTDETINIDNDTEETEIEEGEELVDEQE